MRVCGSGDTETEQTDPGGSSSRWKASIRRTRKAYGATCGTVGAVAHSAASEYVESHKLL
jgi:hypothetical protein